MRKNNLSAFAFFLLTSIILIIFPVTLSFIYLHNSVSYINRQIDKRRAQEQAEIEKVVNLAYMDVHMMGYRVVSNSQIRSYSFAQRRDSQEEFEILTYLNSFANAEQGASDNYFVYFPQHDRIISNRRSSPTGNYLRDLYPKYQDSIEKLFGEAHSNRWILVRTPQGTDPELFYVRSITSNTGAEQSAQLWVEMNQNYLKQRIGLYLTEGDCCLLGTDEDLFFCVGDEDPQEDYRHLFNQYSASKEDTTSLHLLSPGVQGLKLFYLEKNVSAIGTYFDTFSLAGVELIFCIVSCALLALYFSRYHSEKLQGIAKALGGEQEKTAAFAGNEYDRIMGYVDSYQKDYHQINEQSDRYRLACQNLYMKNVLLGAIADRESIRKTMDVYDIHMPGELFKLLLFYEAPEADDLLAEHGGKAQKEELEEIIRTEVSFWIPDGCQVFTLADEGRYVCILNLGDETVEKDTLTKETAESIRQILLGFDLPDYCCRESGFCRLEELSEAYARLLKELSPEVKSDHPAEEMAECVRQCLEIIKTQFSNRNLSTDIIATQLGVSRSYLSSLFKQQIGTGLLDYIHHYRINELKKELARRPDMKLQDAVDITGFGNQATLIRVFKKIEGITPGQYRDNIQEAAVRE